MSRMTPIRSLDRLHLLDGTTGAERLPRPVGCEACDRTGRQGRVPVVEMLAAHLLMARKLLAPRDAVPIVAE